MLKKLKEYTVKHEPIHASRHVRLVCIGAGIAGIAAAYKYQQQLSEVSLVIYEKNHDVGGTWLENRYPGCACDIPAHGYTYSWEGNPEWSRLYVVLCSWFHWRKADSLSFSYAEAPEIHAYFKSCAEKWGCMKYIKLSHQVTEARWDEETSTWKIKVKDLQTGETIEDECDVLLSATGVLK